MISPETRHPDTAVMELPLYETECIEEDWSVFGAEATGSVGLDWRCVLDDDGLQFGWAETRILMPPYAGESPPVDQTFESTLGDLFPSDGALGEPWLDPPDFHGQQMTKCSEEDSSVAPGCSTSGEEEEEVLGTTEEGPSQLLSEMPETELAALLACLDDTTGQVPDSSTDTDVVTLDADHLSMLDCQSTVMAVWDTEQVYSSQSPPASHDDTDKDSIFSEEDDEELDVSWSSRKTCPKRKRGRTSKGRKRRRSADQQLERKKEQNKNAAVRYREKKRAEEQENEEMLVQLEKRNTELRARVKDMTHQTDVLRKLIIDIFKTS